MKATETQKLITFYANTKYGYVKRTSSAPYKNWSIVVSKSYDGYLLVEVSFHKVGNNKKRPSDAIYYEVGKVSDRPDSRLKELKKNTLPPWSGWIVLASF